MPITMMMVAHTGGLSGSGGGGVLGIIFNVLFLAVIAWSSYMLYRIIKDN